MGEIIYNKLVRDNIPTIITENGDTPIWHTADEKEQLQATLEKVVEEAKEVLESGGSKDELGDLKQTLLKLYELLGYTEEMIETARIEKAKKRGAFSLNIILDKVVTND